MRILNRFHRKNYYAKNTKILKITFTNIRLKVHHTGRYSKYIRPISILLDLLVVNVLSMYFFRDLRVDFAWYIPYQFFAWFLIAILVRFYEVYRFTSPVEIISKPSDSNLEASVSSPALSDTLIKHFGIFII